MNDLDFAFEESPWEATLATLRPGDSLPASRFLTLLEGEDEADFEAALADLEEGGIALDISRLPFESGAGAMAVRLREEAQLAAQGRLPDGLEKNDPLRLYLEEIGTTEGRDLENLARKSLEGDEGARVGLADALLPRVAALAMELAGRGVLLLDLIQEGSLGLWQGILRYSGGDFCPFSDWWIRQGMAKALTSQARADGVGQKLRQSAQDYQAADKRLLTRLGRNPTLEEIALELNMPVEDAAMVEKTMRDARLVAKAEAPRQEDTPEEAERAVEDTAYFQSRQRVEELLSGLDDAEAKLIALRFGLEGGLPLSPQETGTRLGLTADEVVAREAAALAKLRNKT